MSPSGRFQSRVLSQLSQQTLRWKDRAERWLRQAQVTTVWGTQILLYPVYAVFQTGRLVGRQIEQAVQRLRPQRLVARAAQRVTQTTPAAPASLTADTPIRKVLQAVEELGLDLAVGTPVAISPVANHPGGLSSLAGSSPQQSSQQTTLPAVPSSVQPRSLSAVQPESAASSAATLELAPYPLIQEAVEQLHQSGNLTVQPDWEIPSEVLLSMATSPEDSPHAFGSEIYPSEGQESATVQGIASLLSSRELVLVTEFNDILDILTSAQQGRLQRQMIWELADYGRSHRLQPTNRPVLPLPPPVARETMVLPVKAFYQLMGWVQRGSVAIAANLFEETTLALYFPDTADLELEAIAETDEQWLALTDLAHERSPNSSSNTLPDLGSATMQTTSQAQALDLAASRTSDRVGVPSLNTAIAPLPKSSTDLVGQSKRDAADEIAIAKTRIEAYIETQATIVGYEKHPLERLLAWIDQQMLWLERRVINVLNWLRGLPDDT